ncbi:MAG: TonB-dependent siderophore receptor [Comamonadaceae bacterium PBBC2]|nr:MAG: TonB-dependent siderophore receptor [Comamonadaceae bacterium PBBC2]
MTQRRNHAPNTLPTATLLPLAALMLAGSLSSPQTAAAQEANAEGTLKTVTVRDKQESPTQAKESLLVKKSGIAKGDQALKDIPQTVTVMTEKLMNDRNLDDLREVLKTTSGVTFLAGETGEEDVRMRGFSLQQAGDIYVDGLRDAPLIERDTFNLDRVEVLKGSASMLFGKGSTGGVVNQVNKQPFLMDQNEVNLTVGNGNASRLTGDFNKQTGEDSALRINAVVHKADNWGAAVDKKGAAASYRWGIGERDEFTASLYHLETHGRPLYSHPWMVDNGTSTNGGSGANTKGTLVPVLDAKNFYGMASDHLRTDTTHGTLSHKHRFDQDSELKTTLRYGQYSRDLLGTQVGFKSLTQLSDLNDNTALKRSPKARFGDSDVLQAQSDYSSKFQALGFQHSLIAGVDVNHENARRNNSATTGLPTPYADSLVGTPNNGVGITDSRVLASTMSFKSQNLGTYVQDTVQWTDEIKLQGGLRVEHFSTTYTDAQGYSVDLSKTLASPRIGALWQPNANSTYYTSWGTSYNTSGDTYLYGVGTSLAPLTLQGTPQTLKPNANLTTLNTPPEKSRNFEVGGKWELFEGKSLLGLAFFHSEKYNERNTDVDSATNQFLLSGKRHATGLEFNFAGRLSPAWEMFYNHTWIPNARIDVSSATGNMKQGDRPGLTPEHSASLWSTYRVAPLWRVGAGLNYRGQQTPLINASIHTAAFTTVDAMVEHTVSDNTVLKLNVSNLSNKLYIDQVYSSFYIPGTTRRVELSMKTLF